MTNLKSRIIPVTGNYLLLSVMLALLSCQQPNQAVPVTESVPEEGKTTKEAASTPVLGGRVQSEIGKNVLCILQDRNYNYWFATNREGVYRYDGNMLIQFTENDGLCNNQVQSIQEDASGNIWFGTGGGVSRFDGRTFTTFPDKKNVNESIRADTWKTESGDLWFEAGAGAYRYDGHSFIYLRLPKADSKYARPPYTGSPYTDPLSAYSVYCTLKDKKGNLWFGTQTLGVCRYDGKSFTWLTEKGLSGPAVRGLFEDKDGNLWFGNNGYGLFRYDGESLSNFTAEKGLGNADFFKTSKVSGKAGPGTLARVWTINQDQMGDLWIGTIDAGVWRYDGDKLTNYTINDGLSSNAINTIYKDKNAELWFGTDGAGVCKFDGVTFSQFTF